MYEIDNVRNVIISTSFDMSLSQLLIISIVVERRAVVFAVLGHVPAELPSGFSDRFPHQAPLAQRHQYEEAVQLYRYFHCFYLII